MGLKSVPFAPVMSVVGGPGPEFTNITPHLIMSAPIGTMMARACDKRKGG
jgi:hypothetical protein